MQDDSREVLRFRRAISLVLAAVALVALAILAAGCQTQSTGGASLDSSRPAQSLAVDPQDGSLLKAAGGVFRSTDQGASWTALNIPSQLQPGALQHVVTTSAAPGSLIAAGPGAGVVRSDDDGKTWSAVNDGLPSQDVAALAVHSFHPGTLYVYIPSQGIFRTDDGGLQWQRMDDGPRAQVVGLAHSTLPGSMNTGWLYAATSDGPYLSMDCF